MDGILVGKRQITNVAYLSLSHGNTINMMESLSSTRKIIQKSLMHNLEEKCSNIMNKSVLCEGLMVFLWEADKMLNFFSEIRIV